jgi:hypothetical protein
LAGIVGLLRAEAKGLSPMPYNKLWDPLNPPNGSSNFSFEWGAKIILFIGFGFLCLVETWVIHGLWFRDGVSSDTFAKFEIPIFVLFPFLLALAARMTVRKLSKVGEVQPSVSARVQYVISFMPFMAYMAMLQLAKIAFR